MTTRTTTARPDLHPGDGTGLARAPSAAAPLAEAVFGERYELACRFAGWLAGPGTQRGLLGPREIERLWDRHLLNCAAVSVLIPTGARVVDIGSGAGLPGLVLAVARPDLRVVLVESMARRAAFLAEVVADLDLDSVVVEHVRAEDAVARLRCDVATARAVAAVDRLAKWAAPFVRPRGLLLALKGVAGRDEFARHVTAAVRAGFEPGATLVGVFADMSPTATAGATPTGPGGRRLRAVVEARWQNAEWHAENASETVAPAASGRTAGGPKAESDGDAVRLATVLHLVRSRGSRGHPDVV